MFTGLIEEVGTIKNISQIGGGRKITVSADLVLSDAKIDDSIAINGACQTVIEKIGNSFSVIAVEETLAKTTLGQLKAGSKVNLERAMTLNDRLGGHLVQGHVDCVGTIASIEKLSTAVMLKISFPNEFAKLLVNTGSICIDGISLTSAKVFEDSFVVSVIPHTWKVTTLSSHSVGDKVNLEFDIIGKYIDRIINMKSSESKTERVSILDQFKDQPEY